MASIISAGTTSNTALNMTADTSGQLQLATNSGTTAITIDSSQNVGIGTTSPATKFQVTGTSGSLNARINAGNTGLDVTNNDAIGVVNLATSPLATGAKVISFTTYNGSSSAEAMRIDSSGNLLVGQTSQSGSEVFGITRSANTATYIHMLKATQVECTWGFKSSTDSNMYIGSGSSAVGTYGVYLTNTGNSWNAVSDERQKNIIEPIENGLQKVNTLRAIIGSYKNDPKQLRRPFLIAQDVQAVLPEAVNVQDEETGTLGMSYTDVIPLLVAAIKEQQTLITTLQTQVTALQTQVAALTPTPTPKKE